ncbi:MAG TPA: Na+/H+ antiporter NhaC family protein [Woeseiaceae bacterium]|nr:Na+/H+ antiporter NhaC family protein [Woeseiaceae bacterium]
MILALVAALAAAAPLEALEVATPVIGLANVPVLVNVTGATAGATVRLSVDAINYRSTADSDGVATFTDVIVANVGQVAIVAFSGGDRTEAGLRVIPGWVSILPAILAIGIALLFRNVIPALIVGLWIGATALKSFSPMGFFEGLLDSFQVFVTAALVDSDCISIVLFSMMMGGMVGIITRNGGMASIVYKIVSRAKTAVGGQVAVWLMGMMIFFDDYSNTLVVGNTARSLTDHLRISREKLAYIVDSTAAPVACIALVTTWIGYEIGLVQDALKAVPALADQQAYAVFLHSIPYSFYPILAIVFVLLVGLTDRDFGPMYKAEVRARGGQVKPASNDDTPAMEGDELEAKQGIPLRAANAIVPIVAMIVALAVSLVVSGEGNSMSEILGSADPYKAMMHASFVGVLVAATLTVMQRIMSMHETVDAWYGGVRATLFGMIILILAWTLSDVTQELNTAGYLVTILADSLPVAIVPAIIFVLAAVTAFTTGTSWGTMGILMPLIVPLAWAVMGTNGIADAGGMHVLYSSVASCLAGAVWGDHCSPISDTTVLSSVASGCNHIEHVRTQLPYAVVVGAVALFVGTIPGGFGMPPWVSLVLGVLVLVGVLRVIGKKPGTGAAAVS